MSKSRGANMSMLEDESLCRAYVIVSLDSVNGANQTGDRLWELVSMKYHQQPGITNQRTPSSLSSRFHAISSAVLYYLGKLSHAMNNQGSGTNEMDWVNEARDAYQIEKKKPFLFDKCYQILKDHPRFDLSSTYSNTQRSRFGPGESGGSSINLNDSSSPIDIEGPDDNRPTGRNEAKMQQKRKGKATSLSVQNAALERAESFAEFYKQNAANNQDNQQLLRDQVERLVKCREEERERNNREEERRNREEQRLAREEERLLREEERKDAAEEAALIGMDLSRMTPQQQELYNYRINELLMKRRQSQHASQNYSNSRFF